MKETFDNASIKRLIWYLSVIYRKYIFYNYYLEKNLEINDAYTAKPKSYRICHQTDDSFYINSIGVGMQF